MAEQPPFFDFLVSLLQSIRQGVTGTTRAAHDAAKEARAAKEAAQRRNRAQSGGGGGFDVLSGRLPGDSNARSITRMLRDGVFGKGGQPPPVPPSTPPALPAGPPRDTSTYDFADATYDLAPEPESEPERSQSRRTWRDRISGLGQNAKAAHGRMWARWKNRHAYNPEKGVPPLPKPIDIPGEAGAAGEAAGAAATAEGAEATAATGAATALGSLTAGVTAAVASLAVFSIWSVRSAKSTLEAAKELGRFSPALARLNAQMTKQEIRLDIQQAKLTSGTTTALGKDYMLMQQEMAPLRGIWTNLTNKIKQLGVRIAAGAAAIGNWYAEVSGLKALSNWLNDDKSGKPANHPFLDIWNNTKMRRYHNRNLGAIGLRGGVHGDVGLPHADAVALRQLDREAQELQRRHAEGLQQHLGPEQRKVEDRKFRDQMAENRRRRQDMIDARLSPAKRRHLAALQWREDAKRARTAAEREAIRAKARRDGVKIAAVVLPDLADQKNQRPKCQLPEHMQAAAARGFA